MNKSLDSRYTYDGLTFGYNAFFSFNDNNRGKGGYIIKLIRIYARKQAAYFTVDDG